MNRALCAHLALGDVGPAVLFWLEAVAQWPLYALPVLIVGLWTLGSPHDREAAVLAAISACLALLVAHEASQLIDHPRPFMVGLGRNILDHAADSSFPSDHTTLLFALAVSLGLRPPQSLPRLGVVLALAGVAVGWARVALGVHFPIDIAGAILIGTASAWLVVASPFRRIAAFAVICGEEVRQRLLALDPKQKKGPGARPAG